MLFRYGFRVSAVRTLDREDLILTEPDNWPDEHGFSPHLRLKDRPELGPDDDEGLPLKNKREELAGRRVPLQPEDAEVFRHYIENGSSTGAKDSRKEHEESDEYGLHGLLTGEQRSTNWKDDQGADSLAHLSNYVYRQRVPVRWVQRVSSRTRAESVSFESLQALQRDSESAPSPARCYHILARRVWPFDLGQNRRYITRHSTRCI